MYAHLYFQTIDGVKNLTNLWCASVTNQDVDGVVKLFDKKATLVGTVSQIIRKDQDIRLYFNYFCNLPGLKIIDKQDNIQQIDSNTTINVAYITWMWDGLKDPIVARMTFVYNNNVLVHLHSSKLPELNSDLVKRSLKN
jgi:hypothetical protein